MSEIVAWNLLLTVRDGKLDTVKNLMAEMVRITDAEPGALTYEWFLSSDGTRCHIYERYNGTEAAMAHIETFGKKFAERFMACLAVESVHAYGTPAEEVRSALDGFGAVYFDSIGGFSR